MESQDKLGTDHTTKWHFKVKIIHIYIYYSSIYTSLVTVPIAVWQFSEPDLYYQPPAGRLNYYSLDPQGGGKMFLVVGDTYN